MLETKDEIVHEVKNSSAINKFVYHKLTKTLIVVFQSGDKRYEYPNVPENLVREWMRAESKGRYYHKEIRKYGQI